MRWIVAVLVVASSALATASRAESLTLISARVVPYLKWNEVARDQRVQVAAKDIENGFVDVAGPVLDVRSNNRDGVVAVFRLSGDGFSSARVQGFEREIEVGRAGAFVIDTFHGYEIKRDVQYRLYLAPNMVVGEYPVPLTVQLMQPRSASR